MNSVDTEESKDSNQALDDIDISEFTEEFNEVEDELGNEIEDEISNEILDTLSNTYNRNHGGYRKHSRYKRLRRY